MEEQVLVSAGGGVGGNVWRWRSGACDRRVTTTGEVCVAVDGDTLLTAEGPLVRRLDTTTGEEKKSARITCGGHVLALAISPCGNLCATAVGEKVGIWRAVDGRSLCPSATAHFRPITKLHFCETSSRLVSGGEDALVLVWSLSQWMREGECIRPEHTLTAHKLPVSDIRVCSVRIISASLDRTVAVHRLYSGQLLLVVPCPQPITALAIGPWRAYAGTSDGRVLVLQFHVAASEESERSWSAHVGSITALDLSADGLTLASGGSDKQVVLWHAPTGQKVRALTHGAAPSMLRFAGLTSRPSFAAPGSKQVTIRNPVPRLHSTSLPLPFLETPVLQTHTTNLPASDSKLRQINANLYRFCLDLLLQRKIPDESLDTHKPHKKRKRETYVEK